MGRDPLEDLRIMGEAVELVGDTPPEPETPKAEQDPVDGHEQVNESAPQEDNLVGGLDQPLDGGEVDSYTLEDLLGVTPKQDAGEAQQPPADTGRGSENGPNTEEPPRGVEARIKEVTDEKRALAEQNEKLVEALLKSKAEAPAEDDHKHGDDFEPDPDVESYMNDYIDRRVDQLYGEKLKSMEQAVEPLREKSQDAQLAASIGRHVDGFKPEMIDDLKREYESLPEDEKALYGEGVAGAVLLAQRMEGRGASSVNHKQKITPSRLGQRHSAEVGGDAPTAGAALSQDELASALQKLDGADVLRMLDQMENNGY